MHDVLVQAAFTFAVAADATPRKCFVEKDQCVLAEPLQRNGTQALEALNQRQAQACVGKKITISPLDSARR
jgi:hypothetical protein